MKIAIAVCSVLLLAACGGGSEGASAGSSPQCADTFKVGATIPKDFDGCYDGDGAIAAAEYECEDGQGDLAFTDEAFGRLGGVVQERTEDAYDADFEKCKGL